MINKQTIKSKLDRYGIICSYYEKNKERLNPANKSYLFKIAKDLFQSNKEITPNLTDEWADIMAKLGGLNVYELNFKYNEDDNKTRINSKNQRLL